MPRSLTPCTMITLIGVTLIAFVAFLPPKDEGSENVGIACVIIGLCFATLGLCGMVRATMGGR